MRRFVSLFATVSLLASPSFAGGRSTDASTPVTTRMVMTNADYVLNYQLRHKDPSELRFRTQPLMTFEAQSLSVADQFCHFEFTLSPKHPNEGTLTRGECASKSPSGLSTRITFKAGEVHFKDALTTIHLDGSILHVLPNGESVDGPIVIRIEAPVGASARPTVAR